MSSSSESSHSLLLPPPPEPRAATAGDVDKGFDFTFKHLSDQPLLDITNIDWDISAISSNAALRMLTNAVQTLAESTGDVPPTPPVSRPATPRKDSWTMLSDRRSSSPNGQHNTVNIGSPEALPCDPLTVQIGVGVEDVAFQRIAIARRFFSKTAPDFSLDAYLTRFHHYCPHSPGVYLAAAVYCHRLCVSELMVPATNRTVHRLLLAAICVAAKALEDNRWPQARVATIGGISRTQLMNLELALCYLLDFDLGTDSTQLAKGIFALQQAAKQNRSWKVPLRDAFRLRLPRKHAQKASKT